jgi:hypothetical protein
MDGSQMGWVLVALVCVTAVVSGPLVPQVDLTESASASGDVHGERALGNGSASLAVEPLPAEATLSPGRFDAAAYYLRTPQIRVTAESVTGRPILVCQLDIPALGYSTSRLAFLNESATGPHVFEFETGPFGAEQLDAASYRGELSVFLRTNGEKEVVASRNVTVVVES